MTHPHGEPDDVTMDPDEVDRRTSQDEHGPASARLSGSYPTGPRRDLEEGFRGGKGELRP